MAHVVVVLVGGYGGVAEHCGTQRGHGGISFRRTGAVYGAHEGVGNVEGVAAAELALQKLLQIVFGKVRNEVANRIARVVHDAPGGVQHRIPVWVAECVCPPEHKLPVVTCRRKEYAPVCRQGA